MIEREVKSLSNIVILVGSVRKNGNTALLAQSFAEGAALHNNVETISVADHKTAPCTGCNACFVREGNACFQKDDMTQIYEKLRSADIVVIASPVYFYGVSAQLKAVIDRLHNPIRNTFRLKKLGLLLVGAADLPNFFDPIIMQYRMTMDYFGLESIGSVLVRGVKNIGDIKGAPELKEAYELGASLK